MQKNSGRLAVLLSALPLLVAASFWHGNAQADNADAALSFSKVVDAYKANPKDAAAKYTQKRLAFSGRVMRMGSEADGTYFGAVADDGERFDTHFDVADQKALLPKFKDQKMAAYQPSTSMVFECLNEGFVATALIPSLKLTHCRLVK